MAIRTKRLVVPLPPSVNKLYFFVPRLHRFVISGEAKNYYSDVIGLVQQFCKKNKIKPIEEYKPLYIDIYLRRRNSDSHNYFKVLFDCLQKGELFKDDRYIMARVESISIDTKNPRVEMWI